MTQSLYNDSSIFSKKLDVKKISLLLLIVTSISFLIYLHPTESYSLPVQYNQTALAIHWLTHDNTVKEAWVSDDNGTSITGAYKVTTGSDKLTRSWGDASLIPSVPISIDVISNKTAVGSTNATQFINVNIGNHHSRVVFFSISFLLKSNTDHNSARINSVTINGTAMSLISNKTVTSGTDTLDNEIWEVKNYNPKMGLNHFVITPHVTTTYYMEFGVISLYNVAPQFDASTGQHEYILGSTTMSSGTSITPTSSITPIVRGELILSSLASASTSQASASSDTLGWNSISSGSGNLGSLMYKTNPTGNSTSTLTWTTTNSLWSVISIRLHPVQDPVTKDFWLACSIDSRTSDIIERNTHIPYSCIFASANTFIPYAISTNTGESVFSIDTPIVDCTSSPANQFQYLAIQKRYFWECGGVGFSNTVNDLGASTSPGLMVYGAQKNTVGAFTGITWWTNATTIVSDPNAGSYSSSIRLRSTNATIDISTDPLNLYHFPPNVPHYYKGLYLQNMNLYTNSAYWDQGSILDTGTLSAYRQLLTIPCPQLVGFTECSIFSLKLSGTQYIAIFANNKIYYNLASTLNSYLSSNNYASQSYYPMQNSQTLTTLRYYLPFSSYTNTYRILGPSSFNTTQDAYGVIGVISGYKLQMSLAPSNTIRLTDPQWTNLGIDTIYGIVDTGSTGNFPVFLTISNAPVDAAVMITDTNIFNGHERIWAVQQLDGTRSTELDLTASLCYNVYVADISQSVSVWNYQGTLCTNGLNQKTIAYTNTLPIAFWTSKYSATHSYTPNTNALSVTTRSTVTPFTELITIRSSNGTLVQNFTATVNGTIDTQSFNLTGVSKPATLEVDVGGSPIYSAFLGSSVSFASASSFFQTYFSYHGFNLLSLLPLIFAGMFTRNTVGIGAVAVVLLIASLNFFSVVVVSEAVITAMMFIALIGLVAYRVILY